MAPPSPYGRIKARPPYAAPGQVIGLLGGSFNPPHAAHRLISETALKRLGLDKIWWIVSPGNPLKSRSEQAPLSERMVLCRAMAKNPRIEVTDFEADLPTPFTASTIAFLKRRSPLVRFIWIMGADNLASFHRWQNWREIFTNVPVVVVDRPGWRMKALASKAARAFAGSRMPEADAAALSTRRRPPGRSSRGPCPICPRPPCAARPRPSDTVAKRSHSPDCPGETPRRPDRPSRNRQRRPRRRRAGCTPILGT